MRVRVPLPVFDISIGVKYNIGMTGNMYGFIKAAGMCKLAGDADTLTGNIKSTLLPFGTVMKVKDRDEGVLGWLTRSLAQTGGATTGFFGGGLGAHLLSEALADSKNSKLRAIGKLIGQGEGLPAAFASAAAGGVAGDRAADYVLN